MPFVDERISAEDGVLAHWEQHKEYQRPASVNPTHWVIDRERDVFVWHIKGPVPGWPNQIFGLSWKGDAGLRVEVIETMKDAPGTAGKLCDTSVEVLKIKMPDSLKPELDFIKSVLKEAFDVYARRFGEDGVGSVLVSIF